MWLRCRHLNVRSILALKMEMLELPGNELFSICSCTALLIVQVSENLKCHRLLTKY